MAIGDVLFDAQDEIRAYLKKGYGRRHREEIEMLLEVMDAIRLLLDRSPLCDADMDVEVKCLASALRGIDFTGVRHALKMWTKRVETLQSAEV